MSKIIKVHGPLQASNKIFPDQKVPIYNIYIENDYYRLYEVLENLNIKKGKIMIVSDTNIGKHYISPVMEIAKEYAQVVESFVIAAGEEYKNLETIESIYEELILKKFDRNDVLFALGGGVIGDMTGYAASTYLRGIRFIQLPTSLLSMVDSSIGGKTGVDFKSYKNMVGAFYQPQAVYINLSVLDTLPEREFYSGFGEIIKHGCILEEKYFKELKLKYVEILNRDYEALEKIIYGSCLIKQMVVENDPTEKNMRALLNFGHTIGHSVERYMNFSLLHGECVAIGMIAAGYLSWKRKYISQESFEEILSLIQLYHLPTSLKKKGDDKFITEGTIQEQVIEEILSITKHDKKMDSGQIKVVLLHKIGEAYVDKTITEEELKAAIGYILEDIF